jgi:transposase
MRDTTIQDRVLLLLDDAAIPPTNHANEQAIRMSTIFRKVTNRFHSAWDAICLQPYARL